MKSKFFKTIASMVIVSFFLFLAFGSDDSSTASDCPPEYKDQRCSSCNAFIGCSGYDASGGAVVGPWANYHYCHSCAELRVHQP